jgi:GntR family transcriptional repressor for pyruvate dehydrogenase complex
VVRKQEKDESSTRPSGGRVGEAHDKILKIIRETGMFEGARLPSEVELASMFGISRPVIRQAMSRLEQAGVVDIKWGAGTYIRSTASQNADNSAASIFGEVRSLEHIRYTFEIRRGIEAEIAALAAERADDKDRELIAQANEQVSAALFNLSPSQELDVAFHFAIATACHNPFYEKLMLATRSPILRCAAISKMLVADADLPLRARAITQEHQRIVDAIIARDPEAARQATRAHIQNAFLRVSQGTAG